jgi:hypothetical protein
MNRRRFLSSAAQLLALGSSTALGYGATTKPVSKKPRPRTSARARAALQRRLAAAHFHLDAPFPQHERNDDREKLDPTWALYTKGLPHRTDGVADAEAVKHLWHAMETRSPRDFEDIPLGGYIKLANPQAAYAYDLIGPDSQQIVIAPPPAFSSAAQAAEMVELYWHALMRDVPFSAFASDPTAARACAELTALPAFSGPRDGNAVTPLTLFRGVTSGSRIGPYVSQFLWRDLPWTPIRVQQKIRIAAPERDYMTSWSDWLNVQNGNLYPVNEYEAVPRYIRTVRDLGEYVHRDFTYQAFLGACLMLFRMNAPLDGGFLSQYSISQSGFVTLGPSDILNVVATVANVALKAAWFQKWVLHRRLRPEEYGARVERHASGKQTYPLHMDVLNSRALQAVSSKYGTFLLPQAYPEAAPMHTSYPSGHAAIAGACATALKACFAESFVIPNPQVPSEDGLTLVPYRGAELTVGGEIDKLAENVAIGRNLAGIHWRSDASEGFALGEQVTIGVLREMRMMSTELIAPFALTKFDGTRVEVK